MVGLRDLPVFFSMFDGSPGVAASFPSSASTFAAELADRGWAVIDGFLPGPVADELRRVVLEQKAAGKLCCPEAQGVSWGFRMVLPPWRSCIVMES